MIKFILGLIIGGFIVMVLMCLLQINRDNEPQNKVILWFGHRVALKEIFEEWCKENKAYKDLFNLITFLEIKDLLNNAKVKEFIKDTRKND